jgi:hypothetical protein
MKLLMILACAGGLLHAQSAGVPSLGWVRGAEGGAARRVAGIPGAAQLAERAGFRACAEWQAHPEKSLALLACGPARQGSQRWRRKQARLPSGSWKMRWNRRMWRSGAPQASALVLADRQAARVQVWRMHEEGAPALAYEITATVESAAVSDDGSELLLRIGGELYLVREGGAMQRISRQGAGEFTFLARSHRFAFLDDGELVLADAGGEAARIALAEPAKGGEQFLAAPAAGMILLAETEGGHTLLRAWSAEGEFLGEGRAPLAAEGLARTGEPGVIQILSSQRGPVWMAQARNGALHVFFVPAELPQSEGGEN